MVISTVCTNRLLAAKVVIFNIFFELKMLVVNVVLYLRRINETNFITTIHQIYVLQMRSDANSTRTRGLLQYRKNFSKSHLFSLSDEYSLMNIKRHC